MSEVLARLEPSLGRRWFGVVVLTLVGVLLLYISFYRPPEALVGKIGLPLIALAFLWQAQWNLRVTKTGLVLTREGLFDGNGKQICALYNMMEVDRGVFAFKPSNGFLIRLYEAEPNAWAPGLYWRLGRRLGIGGATRAAQAKAMADILDVMILERSMGPDE
ncbi:MAG: hypothetical protein GY947_10125 [Rhodobacteraceae bacterium]|nr:hypothetical protein [Paracoccaceae bacterium]